MNNEDLKFIWGKHNNGEHITIDEEKLIDYIENNYYGIKKAVERRKWIESLAAVFVIFFFVYLAVTGNNLLIRIGSLIIVFSALLVIYKMQKYNPHKKSNYGNSIFENIKESLTILRSEANFLNSVLYWYILPFQIGIIMFFLSFELNIFTLLLIIFSMLVSAIIYYLNINLVKKTIKPQIEVLEKNLKILTEE